MSSNSSSVRGVIDRWKERTKFTITTNGTPFGQYRGIVFLSQLGPNTRKVWASKSLDDPSDDIIIGPLNHRRPSTHESYKNSMNIENVIVIQNRSAVNNENVSDIEPDYNYGHYDPRV